jgi:hypothetical protein
MSDWVTSAVEASGDNALSRKLRRLRDLADHAMVDSPQYRAYGTFYDLLQNRSQEQWRELLVQAEAEEQAVQRGEVA